MDRTTASVLLLDNTNSAFDPILEEFLLFKTVSLGMMAAVIAVIGDLMWGMCRWRSGQWVVHDALRAQGT